MTTVHCVDCGKPYEVSDKRARWPANPHRCVACRNAKGQATRAEARADLPGWQTRRMERIGVSCILCGRAYEICVYEFLDDSRERVCHPCNGARNARKAAARRKRARTPQPKLGSDLDWSELSPFA